MSNDIPDDLFTASLKDSVCQNSIELHKKNRKTNDTYIQ